ncbi:HAD family hydrolase [Reinekea blandensis]|uniref:Uncharacterized protein n=1 Tax=Reinekea blandensis MED297 TaxID=314283 RepID=A4BBR8_9GAMM|nr:HAD family hydrolase [Reinekea blandensis]EAR10403.1 hypothetical protein MED297_01240 [Reinekea sp. MED297] [Reinekea blandensis MED297]
MTRFNTILFDYGNTLVHTVSLVDAAMTVFGSVKGKMLGQSVEAQIQQLYHKDQCHQPDWKTVWQQACKDAELVYSDDVVFRHLTEFVEQSSLVPKTHDMLRQLKGAGVKMGLLSNVTGPADVFQNDLINKGIAGYFDTVLWSSAVGTRKPAPSFFTKALQMLSADTHQTLMVGDSELADVYGAKQVGVTTLKVSHSRSGNSQADHHCTYSNLADYVFELTR